MKYYIFSSLIFIFSTQVFAQGISRTYGLGIRGGIWKRKDKTMSINVSSSSFNEGSVDVGGVGGTLYFFSRVAPRWFLETSIGANADIHVKEKDTFSDDVDVAVLMPFLFGLRFDVLPTRIPTNFQPYISGGLGPYWMLRTKVEEEFVSDDQVSMESDLNFGVYGGTGMHLAVSSWFGFNLDCKYHFVDLKPSHEYSGFEFSTGFLFMWGRKREIFRVNDIQVMVKDIYPAYYQFYNSYPLAVVHIQNTANYPIEVNIKSNIKGYSERIRESGFVEISRKEIKEIPILVFLGSQLLDLSSNETAVIDLEIEARAGVTNKKSLSAQIMMHSKNAWNGEIDKLRFFITPENERVLALARETAKTIPDSIPPELEKFQIARMLFKRLQQMQIRYLSDPNVPFYKDDRVQFARKTLELGTGDCDDLVVLYASLLESQGIETAFVDVQDPKKPMAHVYLLFDTGIASERGGMITTNEKKYIVRKKGRGGPTIWIPVETTMMMNGFDEAWSAGAIQYLQEAVLRSGIAEGWIRIVDVD